MTRASVDTPGTTVRGNVQAYLAQERAVLGEHEARTLLGPTVPFGAAITCLTPDDARAAAEQLGGRTVVKALTPALLHKTDYGLVETGCADPDEAFQAARRLVDRVTAAAPGDAFVLSVQTELRGTELAMGLRRDSLGAICMVSAGGTLIEVLDDAATAMAPLGAAEALELVESLRLWPLLEGHRGEPGVDVGAVVDLLVALSQLAVAVPEIAELDLNPVFADPDGCLVADARCVLAPVESAKGDRGDGSAAVRRIFEPRRIAVVGASSDTTKVGGLILRYLRKHEWAGEILAVNPKPLDIPGVATYPSIGAIEGEVDLACIAVPAGAVGHVIDDCVAAGVPAGIVFSAGFAESGEEGGVAQRDLLTRAGDQFRFVGPNTIGIASPADRLFATFGMVLEADEIEVGRVGLISQSGAIASSLVSRGGEFGIGFSRWISTGNEADLGVADYIEYLAEDPDTDVIALFLEVVRDPHAFARACSRARAAGKPVVAVKTGRSEAGRAAAISHTGALTGSDTAYRAYLRRCGVLLADSLPGFFSALQGLQSVGPVAGPRMAIVSMSGGACSLLADACAERGLDVPPLSEKTQAALREIIPSFGGVLNPVDVTAAGIGTPDLVGRTLEVIRRSGETDLVLLQLSTNADPAADAIAAGLVTVGEREGTPFLVGRLGSPALAPNAIRTYRAAGRHVFAWPDQLVDAADACVQFGRMSSHTPEENA